MFIGFHKYHIKMEIVSYDTSKYCSITLKHHFYKDRR